MLTYTRKIALSIGVLGLGLAPLAPAQAVNNAGAISWSAAPANFVVSLYVGVLGRSAANANSAANSGAVAAWAGQVTSDPSSRLRILKGFVGSPEYKQRYGSTRGDYTLGYRVQGNRVTWSVYRGSAPGFTGHTSGISFGYASALRGYYNQYASRR